MNTATEERTVDMLDITPVPYSTHNTPALQGSREITTEAPAKGSPLAGALAFLQAGGNPEQLREMMQLEREWKADLAKQAFNDAMAAFKLEAIVIIKDKTVSYPTQRKDGSVGANTSYKHATLGNVVETVMPRLAAHGLSHSWNPRREADRVVVTCTITHKQGHSESVTLDAPLDSSGSKNNIQAMGSSVSYLSRYTFLSICGLATKEMDDDAKGAGGDPAAERLQTWELKARSAATARDLHEVRREGTKAFQEAKDREGYSAFAIAIKARAAQLEVSHA